MPKIVGPKDFWIGLIYIGFGGLALYIGWDYKFGTGARMGPGYFPLVLAWMLVIMGGLSLISSVVVKGTPISEIAWLPLALTLTAVVAFGFLLPRMGAFVALCTLSVISAMASNEFKFESRATLGLIGLVLICVLIFINGLGVPMPVLGTWLEPWLGPIIYPITGIFTKANVFGYNVGILASLLAICGAGLVFLFINRKA
jgi:hypothetical protein